MQGKDIVNKFKEIQSNSQTIEKANETTLYRVVPTQFVELYKTNPSEVPFVSGALCIEKHKNTYEYQEDKEYVHFFPDLKDAVSMFVDYESQSGECSILKFSAPTNLVEQNTATGKYLTDEGRFVEKEEVVIPKEDFLSQVKLNEELERQTYYVEPAPYDPDAYMY